MFQGGCLYLAATPIGNICDLSLRVWAALTRADVVLAEDTRVTAQLMHQFGIVPKKMLSVREHNEKQMSQRVVDDLKAGLCVVYCSDAGTPGLSDPGARLAQAVWSAGLQVVPLPGPCAAIAAFSASGLTHPSFTFWGFLPEKSTARQKVLARMATSEHVSIVYEAPHRLYACLRDMHHVFGPERHVVLAREISKTYETIHQAPIADLLDWAETSHQARGECVLLVDAAPPATQPTDEFSPTKELADILTTLHEFVPTKILASSAQQLNLGRKTAVYDWLCRQKK